MHTNFIKYYNKRQKFFENSSFPIFIKVNNNIFPLIDEDKYCLKRKIQYTLIDTPSYNEIKKIIIIMIGIQNILI